MDVIANIKDRLPCLEYLQRDGLKFRKEGAIYKASCPLHSESASSFTVYPKTDSWYCFGCVKGGDIFVYHQLRHSVDFREALVALAREAGVELRDSVEYREKLRQFRERGEVLTEAVKFYHKQLRVEHRQYLSGRGFRDDFIDQYLFGFAEGDCIRVALKGIPLHLLQDIGLVNDKGRDHFWNRLTIPIYGIDGSVVNIAGRALGEDPVIKYVWLPGEKCLINEAALRTARDYIYLCEGDTDTPTLVQAGLLVVGVAGVGTLKDDYADKFKRVETVYVCADADVDNVTGQRVRDAKGEALIHRAGQMFGNRARIVELPLGEDVNSFVGQKGGDITALAKEAQPYLEWLLNRMPEALPADRADQALDPVLVALSRFGKAAQDMYAKQIAKRFGISLTSVREAIRERETKQQKSADQIKLFDAHVIWRMPHIVNPAQDLVGKTMLTTVFLDVVEEDPETKQQHIKTKPHVITSDREMFLLTEGEMWKRSWRFASTKVPAYGIVGRRWSTDEAAPHSVKQYLDGKVSVHPWEVYQAVVGVFHNYVDYPNDLYYDCIALWTIATYWFNLYPAFPYLHFFGFKRVGKSRTLQIIAELAFNALWSASMTAAAAYRTIESCSSTLLLDEAENLRKKDKNDRNDRVEDDKIEILKAGYQKGQKAIRCAGENNEPTGFDLYGPKAFGGTQALDRILADRVIPLILTRRGRELEEFTLTELQPRFAAIRDQLYILMLDFGANIAEEIRTGIHGGVYGKRWEGVRDREKELWLPLLTVAQFIDKARLEEEPDPLKVDRASLLTERMRTLAEQKVQEKVEREQLEQSEVVILETLLQFVEHTIPPNGNRESVYPSGLVMNRLKEEDELHWIESPKMMINQLEKMGVITDRKRDLPRQWMGLNGTSRQARSIRLDPERLRDIAARYGALVTE